MHGIIVEAGGEPALWADALDRAIDVMANARLSYHECTLRQDPYLLEVLGLHPKELSALAALLIGPRRGDRKWESLLVALHHDLSTTTTTFREPVNGSPSCSHDRSVERTSSTLAWATNSFTTSRREVASLSLPTQRP